MVGSLAFNQASVIFAGGPITEGDDWLGIPAGRMRASGTDKGRLENQTSKQYLPCSKLAVATRVEAMMERGAFSQLVLCSGLVQTRLSHRLSNW